MPGAPTSASGRRLKDEDSIQWADRVRALAVEPAVLGPWPGNVHIERYIPQSLLLPHCDLVVCHGGSGTTLASLSHGLPVLVLPQGADGFRNAAACAAAGAGLALQPSEVSAKEVRRAVDTLLHQSAYRAAARRLQSQIANMPTPGEGIRMLELLADQ